MFKLDKNNYDNIFFFFHYLMLSLWKKSETISFGLWNIMIAQQNIDVILSMRNIYEQLLHCYTPSS